MGATVLGCGGKAGERNEPAPVAGGSGGGEPIGAAGDAKSASGAGGSAAGSGSGGDASASDSGAAGMGGEGPMTGPRPYRALQIATGNLHTCALLEDHRVKCWGINDYGQVGLPGVERVGLVPTEMGDALPFVDLGSGRTAKAVGVGRYSTCAILDDDSVKCWGLNVLGDDEAPGSVGAEPGQMGDALPPLPLGSGRKAKALGMGYYDACVALDDDSFYCGGTSSSPTAVPGAVDSTVVSLTGGTRVLGLYADGSLRSTWAEHDGPPALVAPNVVAAAGNMQALCYVRIDGALVCEGAGLSSSFPAALSGYEAIALSHFGELCALREDGVVHCWSSDRPPWASGELGGPLLVPLAAPAVQVSGGDDFHCALLEDGAVECWSWNAGNTPALGTAVGGWLELAVVDLGTFEP